ncbi:hypothetical protein Daesc_006199 [Daldinia eschscholtzii]|uniref:Uncharacterized protein n=1 Tax=Daldinia eschscholtzii TaxID=292717 RepID=A0AAX6MGU7_9PEZI
MSNKSHEPKVFVKKAWGPSEDDANATSDNKEVDGSNEVQIPDNMDLDGNSSATTANNLAAPDDNIDLDDGVPYNDEFLDDGLVPPRLHPNLQQFLNSAATKLDRVARTFYY